MFATTRPPARRLLVFARMSELDRTVLHSVGKSDSSLEIEILWSPADSANGETLRRAFGDHQLAMQTGATFGDRMNMAFSERFFFHRTQQIVAIGVGEPSLDRALIDDAFLLLESCDWVIGPAQHGGFYLIGCRGAVFDPAVFRNVPWDTNAVMQLTLDRIGASQNTVAMLPARDWGMAA